MSDLSSLDLHEDNYAPTQDEKTMAVLAHILTLVAGFIAPLVVFLVKKDESDYVREHAAESLNFQISVFIYALISIPLCLIVVGIFLLFAIGIGALVLAIVATIKASEGKMYRYPLTIRWIK